jgi:phage terminase large subunit
MVGSSRSRSLRTSTVFKPTRAQQNALELLRAGTKHSLLYGGSRSGKTTILTMAVVFRAVRYPGSRHLICRLRLKDIRSSILHETLKPLLSQVVGPGRYKVHVHDNYVSLANGSEIWIGGLGDREQAERILGHEYNTIYFNEISQLSYASITMAHTRLAMTVPGCRNIFLYDCNPGSPLHWSYRMFIKGENPATGEKWKRPEQYRHLMMNPSDNQEHLPEDYITGILDGLPEKKRQRFRDGLWVKAEGCIYDGFHEGMLIGEEEVPDLDYRSIGVDFGLNMAAVMVGFAGETVYVLADHGGYNVTSRHFNEELTGKGWFSGLPGVFCDPAGGERMQEITGGQPASNSVESGIDYLRTRMERGEFFVVERRCPGIMSEIWDYRMEEEKVVKENDHFMDAMRYGVFSAVRRGVVVH